MNNFLNIVDHDAPVAKTTTEWLLNNLKFWKMSRHEVWLFAADEGVHLGALYALNNPLAKETDLMIQATTPIIQKATGWSEEKSHEVSTAAWIWEVPNVLGMLSGFMTIGAKHHLGWFGGHKHGAYAEKLLEQQVQTDPTRHV